ncbi:MAG: hypothetical protein HYR84_01630 [Planctomycetes bacterium]|nr:hypothetical protein [Planctomycetota bacterium]
MKWTVVWLPDASDLLAEIWLKGPDRTAIQAAADQIDWQLKRDPHDAGEERADNDRIVIEPPLAVLCVVSKEDMLVSVYNVWRWSPPRQ